MSELWAQRSKRPMARPRPPPLQPQWPPQASILDAVRVVCSSRRSLPDGVTRRRRRRRALRGYCRISRLSQRREHRDAGTTRRPTMAVVGDPLRLPVGAPHPHDPATSGDARWRQSRVSVRSERGLPTVAGATARTPRLRAWSHAPRSISVARCAETVRDDSVVSRMVEIDAGRRHILTRRRRRTWTPGSRASPRDRPRARVRSASFPRRGRRGR